MQIVIGTEVTPIDDSRSVQNGCKSTVDKFVKKALVLTEGDATYLAVGHDLDHVIELQDKTMATGYINKFHRKKVLQSFEISGSDNFDEWIKNNLKKSIHRFG